MNYTHHSDSFVLNWKVLQSYGQLVDCYWLKVNENGRFIKTLALSLQHALLCLYKHMYLSEKKLKAE